MMQLDKPILIRLIDWLRQNAIIVVFFILFIICSFSFDTFLSTENIRNIIKTASTTGIIAIGMTFVILCGEIDLSVGSIQALSAVIVVTMVHTSVLGGVILSLLAGVICGLCTAALVIKAKIPSFIASLAMQFALRGFVYIFTNERAIYLKNVPLTFAWFSQGELVSVLTVPAIFFILSAACSSTTLNYLPLGRSIYAVGGNQEAAKMMGIKTVRTKFIVFIISGGLSALSGVIIASRLNAAQAITGEGLEMQVIAAVVLGGTLLRGGVGKISGTIFGALFLTLLSNCFNNIGNLNFYWQNVITGVLLLLVVVSQEIFSKSRKTKTFHGS
jgi:ribose/xylose/arabinose/galactoside ABC-type transport system permease subunit